MQATKGSSKASHRHSMDVKVTSRAVPGGRVTGQKVEGEDPHMKG
jgi:hypothetical protein